MRPENDQGLRYYYHSTQRIASFLTVACVLCFVAYSLYMYIIVQRDIVVLAHHVTSGGETLESIIISSILGTLLSALPAVLLLHFFSFPIRLKAVATLPSFVILGMLTGMRMNGINEPDIYIPVVLVILMMLISIAT